MDAIGAVRTALDEGSRSSTELRGLLERLRQSQDETATGLLEAQAGRKRLLAEGSTAKEVDAVDRTIVRAQRALEASELLEQRLGTAIAAAEVRESEESRAAAKIRAGELLERAAEILVSYRDACSSIVAGMAELAELDRERKRLYDSGAIPGEHSTCSYHFGVPRLVDELVLPQVGPDAPRYGAVGFFKPPTFGAIVTPQGIVPKIRGPEPLIQPPRKQVDTRARIYDAETGAPRTGIHGRVAGVRSA